MKTTMTEVLWASAMKTIMTKVLPEASAMVMLVAETISLWKNPLFHALYIDVYMCIFRVKYYIKPPKNHFRLNTVNCFTDIAIWGCRIWPISQIMAQYREIAKDKVKKTTAYLPCRSFITHRTDMLEEPVVLIAKEMNITTERWLISTDSIDILPYCCNTLEL